MVVRRKWGWYATIWAGRKWKIKILRFRKGGEISFQKHHKRGELWLFLSGTGIFTWTRRGEKSQFIGRGDSIHIFRGEWHHYLAIYPTTVLEIQYGDCREDDIERI